MSSRGLHILFLCTANSARSVMAEALMNHHGQGRLIGFSAGSHPRGSIHPMALALLEEQGMPTQGLRSKSWEAFAQPGAPEMDFVFTVCDNAANETCPIWPGHPITAHWGVPDPALAIGGEAERMLAFREAFAMLQRRIEAFSALPFAALDRMAQESAVRQIGRKGTPT